MLQLCLRLLQLRYQFDPSAGMVVQVHNTHMNSYLSRATAQEEGQDNSNQIDMNLIAYLIQLALTGTIQSILDIPVV